MIRASHTAGLRCTIVAALAAIGVLLCASPAAALTDTALSPDSVVDMVNGEVYATVEHEGRLYVGGEFATVGGTSTGALVRYDVNGAPLPALPRVEGGVIRVVTSDREGGFYIGGDFTRVGGQARSGFARIKADGTLDPWAPQFAAGSAEKTPTVRAMAFDSMGRLWVGGYFASVTSANMTVAAKGVVVFAADAARSPTGLTVTASTVWAMAIHNNIAYIGGNFGLAMYDTTTSPTARTAPSLTAGATGRNHVHTLAVHNNSVVMGGEFGSVGGQAATAYLMAFNADGTVSTWKPQPDAMVTQVRSTPHGLFAAGRFGRVRTHDTKHVARIDDAGMPATGFTFEGFESSTPYIASLEGSADGRLYVGGDLDVLGDLSEIDMMTGARLVSLTEQPGGQVDGVLYQPDCVGSSTAPCVIVGGFFQTTGGEQRRNLAAFEPDGSLSAWAPMADSVVEALVVADSPVGPHVIAGGWFGSVAGPSASRVPAPGLAAFDLDSGAVVGGFVPQLSAEDGHRVYGLDVTSQGRLFAGSQSLDNGGRLAMLDASTGALLAPVRVFDRAIHEVVASDTWVVAGGMFASVQEAGSGVTRSQLAAFTHSSSALTLQPWAPATSSPTTIWSLAQFDGHLYAGGQFEMIGGVTRQNLAAFATGTNGPTSNTPVAWTPNPNGRVFALAPTALKDGVLVGGEFSMIATQARTGAAALSPAGTAATARSWAPALDRSVKAIHDNGWKITIGGSFQSVDGTARPWIARFTYDAEPLPPYDLRQSSAAGSWAPSAPELRFRMPTGIAGYHVQVSRDPWFRTVDSSGSVTADLDDRIVTLTGLTDGEYFWRVRTETTSGAKSPWQHFAGVPSFAFGVDTQPPAGSGTVLDGWEATDADWNASATTIRASWPKASDLHSGIESYLWNITTTTCSTPLWGTWRIVADPPSGPVQAEATDQLLQQGSTYRVCMKVLDRAGNVSGIHESDGQQVDFEPPTLSLGAPTGPLAGIATISGSATEPGGSGVADVMLTYSGAVSGSVAATSSDGTTWSFGWDTTSVPDGTYTVTLTATDLLGNGTSTSGTVVVDNEAPVGTFSRFEEASDVTHWSGTGNVLWFNPSGAASFDVLVSASDAGSGIDQVHFPALGAGWTPSTAGSDTIAEWPGLYRFTYSFGPGASEPLTVAATAYDLAGNASAPASFNVSADATPPASGAVSYLDDVTADTTATISFSVGTDADSGVRSWHLQRSSAPLASGTCGAWGAWGTISPDDPASPYADTTLTANTCNRYRLAVADNVGNMTTFASASVLRVDTDQPTGTIDAPTGTVSGTVTVTGSSSDATSGIQGVELRYSGPATGDICLNPTIPEAWSCSWNTSTLPDGTYTLELHATDLAGNASTTTGVVTVDNTSPTVAIAGFTASPGSAWWPGSGQTVWFNPAASGTVDVHVEATDAGSGMSHVELGDLGVTGWTPGGTAATAAGGSYSFAYDFTAGAGSATGLAHAVDSVGNTASTGFSFEADGAAPTGGSISWAGGYRADAATSVIFDAGTDAATGVASWELQRASAPLANGSCGAWDAWATVAAAGVSSPYTDSGLASGSCYRYRLLASDEVGNAATYTSADEPVLVDTDVPQLAPSAPATAGTTVTFAGTAQDANGISRIDVDVDHGSGTPLLACQAIPAAPAASGDAVSWTCDWAVPDFVGEGAHTVTYTAVDFGGTTATATGVVLVDRTGPELGTVQYAPAADGLYASGDTLWFSGAAAALGTDIGVSLTASDAGAGMGEVRFPALDAAGIDFVAPFSGVASSPDMAGGDVWSGAYRIGATATSTGAQLIRARDAFGHESTTSMRLVLDPAAPTLSIDQPAATNGWVRGQVTVSGSVDDNAGGSGAAATSASWTTSTTNGLVCSPFPGVSGCTLDTTTLADGAATITATAADRVGNEASTSIDINIDNTTPAVAFSGFDSSSPAIYQPADDPTRLVYNPTSTSSFDFTVSATATDTGSGIDAVAFPLLGSGWLGCAQGAPAGDMHSCTYTFTPSASPVAPTAPVDITARDRAGNLGPAAGSTVASFSVLADSAAPKATFSSPTTGSVLVGTNVTISGVSADQGTVRSGISATTLTVQAPGSTTQEALALSGSADSWSSAWSTAGLPDGTYTLRATTVDNVGRRSTTLFELTLNNDAAPSAPESIGHSIAIHQALPKVQLHWTAPSDQPARGYDVLVTPAGATVDSGTPKRIFATTRLTLLGEFDGLALVPGRSYDVRVRSVGTSPGAPVGSYTKPMRITVPKARLGLVLSHATPEGQLRSCGAIDRKCAYSQGESLRLSGFVRPMAYAEGRQVRIGLERRGDDGSFRLVEEHRASVFPGGHFVLTVDRQLPTGLWRAVALLPENTRATGATSVQHFMIS